MIGTQGFVRSVRLPVPALGNNIADAERLKAALKKELDTDRVVVPLGVVKNLPGLVRKYDHRLKTVLFRESFGWRVVSVQDPDGSDPVCGIALDIGTTRVVARLIDLETGKTLGESGFDNPQIRIAPDVLARIHHAKEAKGLEELRSSIIDSVNVQARELCEGAGIGIESVYLMACAGNTAMTHLFLGIDPSFIIREPYIPGVNMPDPMDALSVGIQLNPNARIFLFPNIGSYFGGDLIAGILCAGIHKREEPSIMVDVGTNAEVVLGTRDWLIACAGAAGPALEGGMSKMGMTAGPGVIDRVVIDPDTRHIEVHTIEEKPAIGICGSGMIDLAAQLFLSGMVDIRGKFSRERCGDRLVLKDGIATFELVLAADSGTGRPIALSQVDLNSLTSSKAAMHSILEVIVQQTAGIGFDDLERFYVAGTFGSFIDPRSAISIGMLPDIPLEKFQVLGNSSLEGSAKLLLDPDLFDEIATIRENLTYVELNVNQEFMNIFSGAKFYPHTERSRFPSVTIWGQA
ncbi:MAG: ATP-binding protein [Desulfobacteraceae bacterium]|nr:ATP-binding protein [Desulfobacteraceae bacterium]